MLWLTVEELSRGTPAVPGGGVGPHPEQGLTIVPSLIEAAFDHGARPFTLGGAEGLIVLALDGVDYDTAAAALRPDVLLPLTSTFPSTSVTAWLSATTGLGVDEHGVPGVVFAAPEAGGVFHCLADRSLTLGTEWETPASRPGEVIPFSQTMFERLAGRGVECAGFVGDLAAVPGRWADAVVRGMTPLAPEADWNRLRMDPVSVPDAVVREVDRAIRERRPGPLLLWTYVHIDPYIHEHGYDGAVLRCLTALSRAAHRWSAAGFTVIAHSDHGMVETTSPPELVAMFDEVTGSPSCRLPPGGAGRVRWAYPRHGRSDEVLDRLSDGLGDRAWVGRAGDLDKMRVLPLSPLLRERVGEVVAVASGREFPLPEPKPHEHGGLTPEEMIVPLAVWEGR